MTYTTISAGKNPPDEVQAIIEIPAQGAPVKYEVDKTQDALVVDRFLSTAMFYPCNYGYIPQTLSEDGDPIDILVVTPTPVMAGAVIRCRPVGMLNMTDEAGVDTKVLAVPITKLTPYYAGVQAPEDLPKALLATIAHFFEQYKALEPGKWVKVEGWEGAEKAKEAIRRAVANYTTKGN